MTGTRGIGSDDGADNGALLDRAAHVILEAHKKLEERRRGW